MKVSDCMIKNKIYEMILKKYKIFNLEDTILSILEFENEEKNKRITGLLIDDSVMIKSNIINNLTINSKYNIRGNIINLDSDDFEKLNFLIDGNKTLREYINTNEIFQILSIKNVEENPKIKSVTLSIGYDKDNYDITDIVLPIENIELLRIGHISSDIEYLKNGEYAEFTNCDDFRIKINKIKIRKKDMDVLLGNIIVYSVGLFFDNEELINYNMPFCSDDGIHNKFQEIYSNKDSIEIIFDGRYKK